MRFGKIKREIISAYIVMLTLLIFIPTLGHAATGWSDDFESYTLGTFPSTGGWSLIYSGAGSSQQYVDNAHAVSGSQSLHLVGSSCWSSNAYRPADITSRMRLEAMVFVNQIVSCGCTPEIASVGLYNPQLGAWGTVFGAVFFGCDGKIYAIQSNDDRSKDIFLMSYNAGTWYHVQVDVDLTARTFDAYLDGVLLGADLQIMDSGMPTGALLESGHGGNPTVWFDDIKVTPNPQIANLLISPSKGINTGQVTVRILGHDFATGTTAKLVNDNQEIIGTNTNIVDAGEMITTFDLAGAKAPTGLYNLVVTLPDNQQLTCEKCFTVQDSVWFDDFDTYTVGQFPSPNWTYSGNSDIHVDNTVHVSGNQSVRIFGILGSCWGALLHRPLQVSPPFTIEFYVRNGSENLTGCHPSRGAMGLNTGASWTTPGIDLIRFDGDGMIRTFPVGAGFTGNVLGQYSPFEWIKVKIGYEKWDVSTIRASFWINDQFMGIEFQPACFYYEGQGCYEDQANYLSPSVGEGTAWFDDIKVTPGVKLPPAPPVSPSKAANTGQVTITLTGEGFTQGTQVALTGAGLPSLTPVQITVVSETTLIVVFDLTGAQTGVYDVLIQIPGQPQTVLTGALEVAGGTVGQLRILVDAPPAVRTMRYYPWTIKYGNNGGADMPASLFVVSNDVNADMALSPAEPLRSGPMQVLGVNLDGPAGVLPPGSSYSIPVFLRIPAGLAGGSSIGLKVEKLVEDSTPIDWAAIESGVRPADMDQDAWNIIWSNFKAQMGNTWSEYLQALNSDATYISLHRRSLRGTLIGNNLSVARDFDTSTYDVRTLLQFEFARASAALNPRSVLAAAQDVFVPEPGMPLSFGRFGPQSIQNRFRLGPLGRGWTHIYEYSASVDPNNNITIKGPGDTARIFYRQTDGSYKGMPGDYGSVSLSGSTVTLQEKDGTVWLFGPDGTLTSITDPNSNSLTMSYTGSNLTAITHSSGGSIMITCDSSGRISEVIEPAGQTVKYTYDASGQLVNVEKPGGVITAYGYHAADGTPSARALSSITFPDGTHYYYAYDPRGRLSEEYRDGGAEHVSYTYVEPGTVNITDAQNHTALVRFGPQGEVLEIQDPLGALATNAFDAKTQMSQPVGPDGNAIPRAYDAKGNPIGIMNPLNQLVKMSFDQNRSRLTQIIDSRSNQTNFSYDGSGNLKSITYSDSSAESFAYDSVGNVQSYTNRRSNSVNYTRNTRGQVTRKTYPDGRTIDYTYDTRGNLISAADSLTGTITMQYGSRDFLTQINYPGGRGFTFEYNNAGRRTKRISLDGEIVNYQYDNVGRLQGLTDGSGNPIISYEYDSNGRLVKEIKGNSTQTSYEYDAAGQLLHMVNYASDNTIQSRFDYTYDGNGNRTSMTTLSGTTLYTYDAIGQLVGVTYPDGRVVTYMYDAAGNRVNVTDNGVTTGYTTNNMNQYSQVGNATYAYDSDGNMISKTDAGGTTSFEYDAENRLVSVVTPSQGTWEYTYDALGNRIAVNHDGIITHHVHDPIGLVDVVAEYDGSGALVARYIHGLGLVARTAASGERAYYAFDAIGHTRQLTNATGAVVNTYDYSPFGEPFQAVETMPSPFRYAGRFGVMEEGNGFDFLRARFLDPKVSRFLEVDPVGIYGDGPNLYSYCLNNPVSRVDPSGLQDIMQILGTTLSFPYLNSALSAAESWLSVQSMPHWRELWDVFNISKTIVPNLLGVQLPPTSAFPSQIYTSVGGGIMIGWFIVRYEIPFFWQLGLKISPAVHQGFYTIFYRMMTGELPPEMMPRNNVGSGSTTVIQPVDPNEKIGTSGIGDQRYVARGDEITYQIYFENSPTATAPAQEVVIDDALDSNLDWSTFRLGEIAFGNQVVSSLTGQESGADRVPAGNMLVEIAAVYTPGSGQARWTLRTIDPQTGDLPTDPLAGFLPPEDGTGRGGGHVAFKVRSRTDRPAGTQIKNKATISFDTEAPMTTNEVFNTISDASPNAPSGPSINDNGNNVPVSAVLTWVPSEYATSYDIYLWKSGQQQPTAPTATGLSSPFYDPPGDLNTSTTYLWQVVAHNVMGATTGPAWSFTTTISDTTSPSLSIISHSDGQHVSTSSITLSGTSSDSGKGDNGIQQVTVNGNRANNDTATGSGIANWSKVVMLSPGANLITIIAYDDSPNHNQTFQNFTIYYDLATVNCPGDSLQTAVEAGKPGDIIYVNGTCNENILIRNEKQRLTLDGQNVATIHGSNSGSPTLNVRGKGIVIQNFEITGGSDGINVNRGSNPQIIYNNIHDTGQNGIVIDQLAFSVIKNNNIYNNPGDGILVSENSIARIGFDSDSDSTVSSNSIQSNGGNGITVLGTSNARIVDNTIANNTGDGIGVFGHSQADIASNTINSNGGNGISVSEKSGIQLGEDNPVDFFDQPNITTVNNVGFGIACSGGSYVSGHLGSSNQINGNAGQTNVSGSLLFPASCPYSLSP